MAFSCILKTEQDVQLAKLWFGENKFKTDEEYLTLGSAMIPYLVDAYKMPNINDLSDIEDFVIKNKIDVRPFADLFYNAIMEKKTWSMNGLKSALLSKDYITRTSYISAVNQNLATLSLPQLVNHNLVDSNNKSLELGDYAMQIMLMYLQASKGMQERIKSIFKMERKGAAIGTVNEIATDSVLDKEQIAQQAAQEISLGVQPNEVQQANQEMSKIQIGEEISLPETQQSETKIIKTETVFGEYVPPTFSIFEDTVTPSSVNYQISKIDREMTPQQQRDAISRLALMFCNIIDNRLQEAERKLNEKADEQNVNIETIKLNQSKTNDDRIKRIEIEESYKDPDYKIINGWIDEIIPIEPIDVVKKYTSKGLAKMLYNNIRAAIADGKIQNADAILSNFDVLMRKAASEINRRYDINITDSDFGYYDGEENDNDDIDDPSNSDSQDSVQSDYSHADDKSKSVESTLGHKVKRVYDKCYLLDKSSKYIPDSFGIRKSVSLSQANAHVLHLLVDKMIDASDMIPLLQQSSESWVPQLIEQLQNDQQLFNQFYKTYKLASQKYATIYLGKDNDGKLKMFTKMNNAIPNADRIKEQTLSNVDGGNTLNTVSIYDNSGNISSADTIEKVKSKAQKIYDAIDSTDDISTLTNDIADVLASIGIRVSDDFNIVNAIKLSRKKLDKNININKEAKNFVQSIINICDIALKESVHPNQNITLIKKASGIYDKLFEVCGAGEVVLSESSSTQGGKSRYSYAKTNYLDEMLRVLRRPIKGKGGGKFYDEYINNKFKQYELFYDHENKRWKYDWMNNLFGSNPFEIERVEVISSDFGSHRNTEYTQWDAQTAFLSNWMMYHSDNHDVGPNTQGCYYRMTIASDSPCGDYIHFYKYNKDDVGRGITWKELLLDKMFDVFEAEQWRRREVKQHLDKNINGTASSSNIQSYDSVYENGKLKEINGMALTMMPEMNYVRVSESTLRLFNRRNGNILTEEQIMQYNGLSFLNIYDDLCMQDNIIQSNLKDFFKIVYYNNFKTQLQKDFAIHENYLLQLPEYAQMVADGKYDAKQRQKLFEQYEEFMLNTNHAFANIVALTCSDMAFFGKKKVVEVKDIKDSDITHKYIDNNDQEVVKYYKITSDNALETFQKRNKEYHAPTEKINTLENPAERVIYLNDIKISSEIIENVREFVMSNPNLSDNEKDAILNSLIGINGKYSEVNVADGQTFRSFKSMQNILKAQGKLTKDMENSFNRVQQGQWTAGDFYKIMLALKPYFYSVVPVDRDTTYNTGAIDDNGEVTENNKIPMPVQHKNSEFPVMAYMSFFASANTGLNNFFGGLSEFMDKNEIDSVSFTSVVKIGKIASRDLNIYDENHNIKDKDTIASELSKLCGFDKYPYEGYKDVVKTFDMSDWGEQSPKPEHLIDKKQLIGSQCRRLMFSDLPQNAQIKLPYRDKPYSREEFLKFYQALITQSIVDDCNDLGLVFKNKQELSDILQNLVATSHKYDDDLIDMFTWDETIQNPDGTLGAFKLPFWDQTVANKVEELLCSLVKNRVGKQKVRGGAAVQVASVGLSDELNIRFKDKNGNLIDVYKEWQKKNPDKTRNDYAKLIAGQTIAYMECYLPLWSKDLIEKYTRDDGSIDVTNMPKEIRHMIGYRVPTEDFYSIAPLYVKGFLPHTVGSCIMLPADITVIAGSDFDIDVMYLMIPDFAVEKYDYKTALNDYGKALNKQTSQFEDAEMSLLRSIFGNSEYGSVSTDEFDETIYGEVSDFARWFNIHKDNYELSKDKWIVKKINYNPKKTVKENTKRQRNNAMIDCMLGIMRAPHAMEKFLSPGNYDDHKKASRIIDIYTSPDNKDERGFPIYSLSDLMKSDIDTLNDMYASVNKKKMISSPKTAVDLHQQNMTGNALVSIFAASGAAAIIFQYFPIEILDKGRITINGNQSVKEWKVGQQRNKRGQLITKNLAGYLDAAVDNGKDPIMSALKVNPDSASLVVYLTMLGYTPMEIGAFMNVPTNYSTDDKDILDKNIRAYYRTYEDLKIKDMLDAAAGNLTPAQMDAIAAVKNNMMARIAPVENIIKKISMISRNDSINGFIGKSGYDLLRISNIYDSILDAIEHEEELLKHIDGDTLDERRFLIKQLPVNYDGFRADSLDFLYKRADQKELSYLEYFAITGQIFGYQNFKDYMLELTPAIQSQLNLFKNEYGVVNEKIAKAYMSDLQLYSLITHMDMFKTTAANDGNKRWKYLIEEFPMKFELDRNNPDSEMNKMFPNNLFIKNIEFKYAGGLDKHDHLVMGELGRNTTLREDVKNDFKKIFVQNPQLALDLLMYSIVRNGAAFKAEGWSHLVDVSVKCAIPKYRDSVDAMKYMFNQDSIEFFTDMFVANNYKQYRLGTFLSDKDDTVNTMMAELTVPEAPIGGVVTGYVIYKNNAYKCIATKDGDVYVKINPLGGRKYYHEYHVLNSNFDQDKIGVDYDDIENDEGPSELELRIQDYEIKEDTQTGESETEQLSADKKSVKIPSNRETQTGILGC